MPRARTGSVPDENVDVARRGRGRPRTGGVSWHGDKRHRGDPAFGHWDVRVTTPEGRSNPTHLPVGTDETEARRLAAKWTAEAEAGQLDLAETLRRPPALNVAGPERVYFIGAGARVKIGTTINVERRLRTTQTYNAESVELLLTLPGGRAEEARQHERFRASRIRGEWFRNEGELARFLEEAET